ncbi:choice-of-anchor D domain-containing protein [Geovibrio thiophilus]|uniref:Choice-of-anchor D domain-containing protein n=1 Tax=Geovibrio thiophilus TaxID=139438 RepID=A0A3R5UXS2_9BACT|nr:choice-of-anchor D domain-containing protein [Geovibrio thiophilus]QAR32371.1 choice-of-anchor D domain-containing protein [Geovibrio thiophilus]
MRHFKFFLLILSVFITASCGSGGETTAKADFTDGSMRSVAGFTEDGISHTLGTFEEDGDGIPVSNAELNQNEPEVIYLNGHNLWLAVWEDERNAGTPGLQNDIYARYINSDGTTCGSEIIVSSTNSMEVAPKVAFDDVNNTAVITWQDSRGDASSGKIYFKTLTLTDASTCAVTLGSEKYFGFTNSTADDGLIVRESPFIKFHDGTFYFVWLEQRAQAHTVTHLCMNTTPPNEVWAGNTISDHSYLGFATVTTANLSNPSPFPASFMHTADTSTTLKSGNTTIKVLEAEYGADEENFIVERYSSIENPSIDCSNSGLCMVIFEAIRSEHTFGCEDRSGVISPIPWEDTEVDESANIYAFMLPELTDNTGYRRVNSVVLNVSNHAPIIRFDSVAQRYLIAWERHAASVKPKIYGQLLSPSGSYYSGNFQIGFDYESVEHGQTNPNIAYDSTNGRFLVTWADARTGATSLENIDVFGQFVNGAGSLSGSNFPLTTNQYNQQSPSTAYNAFSQRFISVWADARNLSSSTCGSGTRPCGSDIYAIRYALGQPQITLYNETGSILNPAQINFGSINTASTLQKSFKIKNTGDDVLRLKCFSSLNTPFSYINLPAEIAACDNNYQEINPNTEQTYNVTFSPTVNGTFNTSFEIVSNAGYRTIYLTGTAQQASIEVPNLTNNTLSFADTTVDSSSAMSFRIRNNGQVSYTISIQSGSPFVIDTAGSPTLPYTLNAGSEAVFYLNFNPTAAGSVTRTVTISTDAGISTSFNVTGRGISSSNDGDDNGTGGGDGGTDDDDDGEPSGGCSAGGNSNLPIALFALAGIAKVIMRRRKEQE